MSVLQVQFEELKKRFPPSQLTALSDGSALVSVPGAPLPAGQWNRDRTTVYFIAPNGFPVAKPDCFWAEPDLRLVNGALPKNSAVQSPPFGDGPKLWFSWHVDPWNPNRDTLTSYFWVILSRLRLAV